METGLDERRGRGQDSVWDFALSWVCLTRVVCVAELWLGGVLSRFSCSSLTPLGIPSSVCPSAPPCTPKGPAQDGVSIQPAPSQIWACVPMLCPRAHAPPRQVSWCLRLFQSSSAGPVLGTRATGGVKSRRSAVPPQGARATAHTPWPQPTLCGHSPHSVVTAHIPWPRAAAGRAGGMQSILGALIIPR